MILIVDHYDSFTYNIVQYVQELGQQTQVVYFDKMQSDTLKGIDKIILSPGPCTPNEAQPTIELIQKLGHKIPLLGICLGHQCIAQAFGGTIKKAHKPIHGNTLPVYHQQQGLFRQINQPLTACCYHSLVVQSPLPDCLEVTAWTVNEQGEMDEIMALKHRHYPINSIQFHPEAILTQQGHELLANFIQQEA